MHLDFAFCRVQEKKKQNQPAGKFLLPWDMAITYVREGDNRESCKFSL